MRYSVLVGLFSSSCVVPFAVPPVRAEIGGASGMGEGGAATLHVAGGTHLASGTTHPAQRFDVGVGYVADIATEVVSQGGYVDAAVFLERSNMIRTSLGIRVEGRRSTLHGSAIAAKLRVDHEVHGGSSKGFKDNTGCGVMSGTTHGTAGAGLFVEAGPVQHFEGPAGFTATAGLSFRLPALAGVWFGIPGC